MRASVAEFGTQPAANLARMVAAERRPRSTCRADACLTPLLGPVTLIMNHVQIYSLVRVRADRGPIRQLQPR